MDSCNLPNPNDQHLRTKQALYIALFLNFAMAIVEGIAGYYDHSTGLLSDSVDMLGDAFMYGITIIAIHKSSRWQSKASLLKGICMSALAIGVIVEAMHKVLISHELPSATTIGTISIFALIVNIACAAMLMRYRSDNLNMKSVWLCSRNDALSNLGVIAGGALVYLTFLSAQE